jgi:hypothetical protein
MQELLFLPEIDEVALSNARRRLSLALGFRWRADARDQEAEPALTTLCLDNHAPRKGESTRLNCSRLTLAGFVYGA